MMEKNKKMKNYPIFLDPDEKLRGNHAPRVFKFRALQHGSYFMLFFSWMLANDFVQYCHL